MPALMADHSTRVGPGQEFRPIADDRDMNALSESTIPLTEGETEFLKRVLQEAKALAAHALPKSEDAVSAASPSGQTEIKTKSSPDISFATTTFIL
jgi:hypothetical protein